MISRIKRFLIQMFLCKHVLEYDPDIGKNVCAKCGKIFY